MTEAEKYEVLEKIGHGSFGIIRKVRRKDDGRILCRKEINYIKMSQKEREQLHAEFAILSSLRHPNIVGYYHREHLKATQDLHLYMEYCGNGDLGKVIKELQAKRQYAEEGFVWSMFSQLVTALYRCHYGIDPPEVGSNCMGLGNTAKPKKPPGGVMILHRDLKPENVFLGEDNSVKLGDFGLSKIMQSHDFASTYVGTPFYMSPEICAAERYTLKSDIWSLGCIIYELCTKEPPFNANSHFHLVQRIKEGKIAPLPSVYSPELTAVIKDCLKVNPDRRPDTATLLNLPVVKLMRKEKEVVELGKIVRTKEELAVLRMQEAEEKLRAIEAEKIQMRQEIDSTVRREWEVRARLEIDRQVAMEVEKLSKRFEAEVQERVGVEIEKRSSSDSRPSFGSSGKDSMASSGNNLSAVSTVDGEYPATECTDISPPSPTDPVKAQRKTARTPFSRAQTLCERQGTPMDIDMAEASPMPNIDCLSLSPRRTAAAKAPVNRRNIFAAANVEPQERWQPIVYSDSEDDEDLRAPSSPTQAKFSRNPTGRKGSTRPPLMTQKTAPSQRGNSKALRNSNSSEATTQKSASVPTSLTSAPDLSAPTLSSTLKQKNVATSPTARRISKIPSSANLAADAAAASPTRKASLSRKATMEDMSRTAMKNNMSTMTIKSVPTTGQAPRGRTLVELAQARAGGRPIDSQGNVIDVTPTTGIENGSPLRSKNKMLRAVLDRDVPLWDPSRDKDMPSPFMKKGVRM